MTYEGWIIVTGVLVGASCSIIGVLLVLRQMAMISDAISHTVILGLVSAFLLTSTLDSFTMLIGAAVAGLLTTIVIQLLQNSGVQPDAAIGVTFTAFFALGVFLISRYAGNVHLDVNHALMGDIAFVPFQTVSVFGVSMPQAFLFVSVVLFLNVILAVLFYKEWKVSTFDPGLAVALGVPVAFLHYLLMTMTSVTAVSSFDSVGAVLVVAFMIVPAASAYLWTRSFPYMFVLSIFISAASCFSGYYAAKWLNVSISGSMAVMTGVFFLISFLFAGEDGIVTRVLRQKRKQRMQWNAASAAASQPERDRLNG
ncbi:metal ABC transporter permease [Salibacterium halotolerans]|uniref:Manganese/zinc/iron transport system permease protein n=1 Tax=Salibacterium halotolerans TaxID=1884432 RepID=A0A1I5V550_9BACI|nr:metal ABC transporter permease [Salibacterium halotolerans]SFQ02066.1 manganese/zinc/iron transport system permease protein [Salibacterium halotolerans]